VPQTRALGQATENRPQTTRSKPDPTDSNAADDKQGATCKAPLENVHQKIDDMQHAMGNMQQTTLQRAIDNIETTCAMQRAICSEQQTTCNAQRATCNNVEKSTDDSVQRTTGIKATGSGQRETRSRLHATCSEQ
jgi:hypothetical protein